MNRDPGLQPERTVLAWRRTALAYTVVALLAGRLAVQRHHPVGLLAALALWAVALVVSYRRAPRGLMAITTMGYAVLGALLLW